METVSASPDPLMFEAVVRPHRSLSRRALIWVVLGMLAGSLSVTSLMFLLGAWPVIGFNGAEITLAVLMLWLNMRAARAREVITLTESRLAVTRTDIRGRSEGFAMQSYWLNVELRERPGTVPKLLLSARGVSHEVARQLGEAQKRDLAEALARALARGRNPSFDNPQLR